MHFQPFNRNLLQNQYIIAQQPIISRNGTLHGQEMLYREKPRLDMACFFSEHSATLRLIAYLLSNSAYRSRAHKTPYFINAGEQTIFAIDKLHLPTDLFVIEILETVPVTQALIRHLKRMRALGYQFALDDFDPAGDHYELIRFVDFVKVDFRAHSLKEIAQLAKGLKRFPVLLVAEKIETEEEFLFAQSLGFDLFQGYYTGRPQLTTGNQRIPCVNNLRKTRSLLNDRLLNPKQIELHIASDPTLVLKLLFYVSHHDDREFLPDFHAVSDLIAWFGVEQLKAILSMFLESCRGTVNVDRYLAINSMRRGIECLKAGRLSGVSPQELGAFYMGF